MNIGNRQRRGEAARHLHRVRIGDQVDGGGRSTQPGLAEGPVQDGAQMLVSEPAREVRSTAVAAFEAQRTALIESVEPMGVFTALNVPDRSGPTWSQRQ